MMTPKEQVTQAEKSADKALEIARGVLRTANALAEEAHDDEKVKQTALRGLQTKLAAGGEPARAAWKKGRADLDLAIACAESADAACAEPRAALEAAERSALAARSARAAIEREERAVAMAAGFDKYDQDAADFAAKQVDAWVKLKTASGLDDLQFNAAYFSRQRARYFERNRPARHFLDGPQVFTPEQNAERSRWYGKLCADERCWVAYLLEHLGAIGMCDAAQMSEFPDGAALADLARTPSSTALSAPTIESIKAGLQRAMAVAASTCPPFDFETYRRKLDIQVRREPASAEVTQ